MNPVDRIARLGWFATAMLAMATASACASTPSAVSTTTVTSAPVAAPVDPGLELYLTRQPTTEKCNPDLGQSVDFLPRSSTIDRADLPEVDRWAKCLNEPQMQHATVVLIGGQSPSEAEGLFLLRAQHIREALIARGVEARRIVVGATNAAREGGPFAANTGVRLELTHLQTLRAFVPPDTGARATIR